MTTPLTERPANLDSRQQRLAGHYLSLATAVVRRFCHRSPPGVELDDWFGTGYLALVDAVSRWEPYCAARGLEPYLPDGSPEPHLTGYIVRTVRVGYSMRRGAGTT